jgi:hypothetical protein
MKKNILFIFIICLLPIMLHAESVNWFYLKCGVTLDWPNVWRGMDLSFDHSPGILPVIEVKFTSLSLTAQLEGNFSLLGRGPISYTEMTDQLRWRLFGDWFFFQERWLELVFGGTLYENIYWHITKPGALTSEIFTQLRLPNIFLRPAFEIYFDLTPYQAGAYWLFEVSHPFTFLEQSFKVTAVYAHAAGFMKAGTYDFFRNIFIYPLYALLDILPTQISSRLEASFTFNQNFTLNPFIELGWNISPYINRDYYVWWVLGLNFYWENLPEETRKFAVY